MFACLPKVPLDGTQPSLRSGKPLTLSTFLHGDTNGPTTISEIRRLYGEIGATDFLGLYAYATQSGAALFDLELGRSFWRTTPSRWLFGIDYGRTQPKALRRLCSKP